MSPPPPAPPVSPGVPPDWKSHVTPHPYTTAEVAAMVELSPRQVRHLAKKLGLGTVRGHDLWLYPADVEAIRNRPRRGKYPRAETKSS